MAARPADAKHCDGAVLAATRSLCRVCNVQIDTGASQETKYVAAAADEALGAQSKKACERPAQLPRNKGNLIDSVGSRAATKRVEGAAVPMLPLLPSLRSGVLLPVV